MWSEQRRGFTLIELLIVVAIIAILAMIAVPNFLEAQTRAKISRTRTDLRTLGVAEEAYFVDWNSYTIGCGAPENNIDGWAQLTTPVAYTTSLPRDVFGQAGKHVTNWVRLPDFYELGTGAVGVGSSGKKLSNPGKGYPSNTWQMSGYGPDHFDQTERAPNLPGNHRYDWNEASYPWVDTPGNDPVAVSEALDLLYDPTNGTVSSGNLLRLGGMKPGGQVFDLLFTAK